MTIYKKTTKIFRIERGTYMKPKLKFKSTRGTQFKFNLDNRHQQPHLLENIYLTIKILYILIKLVQALLN